MMTLVSIVIIMLWAMGLACSLFGQPPEVTVFFYSFPAGYAAGVSLAAIWLK